ncbi:MAG: hypothetical protein KGJ59_00880 [Bacteroidota bacterium]|nr:hypothetical protein [Bacteroidota bacterium]
MKFLAVLFLSLFTEAHVVAQQTAVYAAVLSTKSFVVGGKNPMTGLFFQRPSDDTLWQHSGAPNVRVSGVAVKVEHPLGGKLLYLAAGNGVHRSTDGGATWKIVTDWRVTEVQWVTIDPRNSSVVYIATPYGVFKSSDGGNAWKEMSRGLEASHFISSIIVDVVNSNIVYCSTEDGAYISRDAAATWQRMGLSVGGVRVIAQDPDNPKTLAVGTEDNGIYISHDGGEVWMKKESGVDHSTFYTVVFDPHDSRILYAGGYVTGVYKSTDSGESWRRTNDGLTCLNVHSIAVDPANSNRIYAASMGDGVFRSDDGGAHWKFAGLRNAEVWRLAIQ